MGYAEHARKTITLRGNRDQRSRLWRTSTDYSPSRRKQANGALSKFPTDTVTSREDVTHFHAMRRQRQTMLPHEIREQAGPRWTHSMRL